MPSVPGPSSHCKQAALVHLANRVRALQVRRGPHLGVRPRLPHPMAAAQQPAALADPGVAHAEGAQRQEGQANGSQPAQQQEQEPAAATLKDGLPPSQSINGSDQHTAEVTQHSPRAEAAGSTGGVTGDVASAPQGSPQGSPKPSVSLLLKGTADVPPSLWEDGTALLVDKPPAWTSFDVCGYLRGLIGKRKLKVGHAGTLDPMATGLLVICTGAGTKSIDSFQAMTKTYTGTLRLGQTTRSQDAMEPVLEERPWAHLTDAEVAAAAARLTGAVEQLPPMYSALSVKGERLYEAARRGETVERQARPIQVDSFTVTRQPPPVVTRTAAAPTGEQPPPPSVTTEGEGASEPAAPPAAAPDAAAAAAEGGAAVSPPQQQQQQQNGSGAGDAASAASGPKDNPPGDPTQPAQGASGQLAEAGAAPEQPREGLSSDFDFRIVCSKGTYVRTLVHDLGQLLGCGAHMTALRRTRNGAYSVEDAWTVPEIAALFGVDPPAGERIPQRDPTDRPNDKDWKKRKLERRGGRGEGRVPGRGPGRGGGRGGGGRGRWGADSGRGEPGPKRARQDGGGTSGPGGDRNAGFSWG